MYYFKTIQFIIKKECNKIFVKGLCKLMKEYIF